MEYLAGYLTGYALFLIFGVSVLFHNKAKINDLPLLALFTLLWPVTIIIGYCSFISEMQEKDEFN